MAAVTGTVALKGHCLAAEGPSEAVVAVAAASQVGDGAVFEADQCDVFVVPSAVSLVVAKEEAAVGAPAEGLVSVLIGIVRSLEEGFGLAAGCGLDNQFGPVPEVCHLFSVGGDGGLETGLTFRGEQFFLCLGGIDE